MNSILTCKQINAYGRYLRDEERAPATIKKYMRGLWAFRAWLGERALTRETVIQWKEVLLKDGLSPATVNVMLSALNGLFRFLDMPECRVRFLRVQRRVFRNASRELTQAEYTRLLDTAARQGRDWLALLMESICATGIRVSEVQYLTVEAAAAGYALVTNKGKTREILLPAKLCRKLLKYAKKEKIVSGTVFRAKDGSAMTRYQIWKAMKTLCRAADVAESKVFPHNLRHLFATAVYRATHDIVKLADLLGHSSINTTRIYLLTTGKEHSRVVDSLGLVR